MKKLALPSWAALAAFGAYSLTDSGPRSDSIISGHSAQLAGHVICAPHNKTDGKNALVNQNFDGKAAIPTTVTQSFEFVRSDVTNRSGFGFICLKLVRNLTRPCFHRNPFFVLSGSHSDNPPTWLDKSNTGFCARTGISGTKIAKRSDVSYKTLSRLRPPVIKKVLTVSEYFQNVARVRKALIQTLG